MNKATRFPNNHPVVALLRQLRRWFFEALSARAGAVTRQHVSLRDGR